MIYSNGAIQVLAERSEINVKISVALEKFKKAIMGKEMDTKKINKMIKEIEGCNNKINQYKNADENKKKQIRDELKSDKELMNREFREMFWMIPASIAMGATIVTDPLIGAIIAGMYTMLVNERLSIDNFYNKLESENNKALNWLKKEKESIESKKNNVHKESVIFKYANLE